MFTTARTFTVSCGLAALVSVAGSALAGPLSPPLGPIGSTMKTLAEVEPRIAINATNTPGDATAMAVITQPGSYYLAGDLVTTGAKSGIRVMADNVTIDLNGMTIRRGDAATSARGIVDDGDTENASQSIIVRNGTVSGFSLASGCGVYCVGNSSLQVENLLVSSCEGGVNVDNGWLYATNVNVTGSGNGAVGLGLRGNDGTVAISCTAKDFGTGMEVASGLARDCTLHGCGIGIRTDRSRIEGCVFGTTRAGAIGVECNAYATVIGCHFVTMDLGVKVQSLAVTVEDCEFKTCAAGIQVSSNDAVIQRNSFKSLFSSSTNVGTCIRVESTGTRATIRNNEGSTFAFGIVLNSAGNTVTGNRFGNPTSSANAIYSFPAGTRYGPIVKAAASASNISVGSSSSGTAASTMGSSDPDANIYW